MKKKSVGCCISSQMCISSACLLADQYTNQRRIVSDNQSPCWLRFRRLGIYQLVPKSTCTGRHSHTHTHTHTYTLTHREKRVAHCQRDNYVGTLMLLAQITQQFFFLLFLFDFLLEMWNSDPVGLDLLQLSTRRLFLTSIRRLLDAAIDGRNRDLLLIGSHFNDISSKFSMISIRLRV